MKLLLIKWQFVLLCLYLLPAIHLWGAHPTLSDSLANDQTTDMLELATTEKYADDSHAVGPLVDFVVYFKKPADWVAPIRVHYWNRLPGNTSTTWPGEVMTACPAGGDWYYFEFNGTTSTNLIFNDDNGLQTADLSRSEDGWYDGAWLASPPAYFTCQNCTTDMDMDGICVGADCDDMNANVPAAPGTACDDGDPNTANDQIQADSCSCQGYGSFTVYFKKPGNWSTPINVHYWDRQPENTSSIWPGEVMTLCGNDWWSYTFTATASTNLLFNDGTGNESGDLSRSSEGWYNNGWVSTGSCTRGGVVVTPAVPTPDEMVTITFDATGSHLAGASQVYFHSGVSITEGEVTNFDRAIGNWGQDDGVGEMVFLGDNTWEISLTSLRDYYAVAETEDVFGLNFLFRNADGLVVEDQGGANYYNPVNTGSYFTIVSPEDQPHLIPLGSSFDLTAGANTAADSWLFEEVDAQGAPLSVIATQMGGDTATQSITLNDTAIRYFKVTANFATGSRYKVVTAKAYAPVCTTPRPMGTQPGINYDPNDPTKATLVLHTPTYTRYKKGTGVVTGMGSTTPKEVVYVIGDFNNWNLEDAYQLCRDTDGWNGTTDADSDDDHGDYWWIKLTGLTPGQPYVFQYLVDGNLQVADPYAEQISDPDDTFIDEHIYPDLPQFPAAAGGRRASVLQTQEEEYVWTAPTFNRPTNNHLNIYELHFRDFTEEGTYLAAIDRLDYLKDLGINAVHVMPVSEFEGNSSWGYNPNFYFAADKAYGTKNDLKKFIDECHKREIQVFNDLVLNHAFYSNVMARLYWDEANNKPATNNPWFNADHRAVADPAGWWGADWNHESEHVQNMIDRILDYWLSEFQFDGFRFDFTKGFTQTGQDPGDPWASTYDQDRIDLLKRMVDNMWAAHPGSVAIFEHLANNDEDRELANHGILMWSGAGHHGAMKNWMLGFNQDDPNIYSTGIYNTPDRNFQFANWMSYMESHDEERQAYEVLHYGNTIVDEPDPTLKLAKAIDRLKLGAAFNLFFPGPRMIWELEELGYDFSINYNGRTGEKPTTWEYFEDEKRRELYRLMSTVLQLRNTYELYASAPDYDNIGWGANAITTPRRMLLNGEAEKYVIVIGNLDPTNGHDAYPQYPVGGTWYRYTGEVGQDGTSIDTDAAGPAYYLEPSEVVVLTNFAFDNEILDENKVQVAARLYLAGAYEESTGLMRDQLRADGVIPLTEPYTGQGYTFVGGGGESVDPSVFTITGSDAIVDWVAVELRSATNPTTVMASRAVLLQRDGDVVDLDGVSTTLDFINAVPGDYYLVIKHRNHLEVSTSEAHFFHPVAFTMDFTKHTATYGTNAQKLLSNGLLGCWPGDANSNSQVQNTDIENYWRPSVGTSGYLPADFNLNGQVQNTDLELHWKTAVGRGAQLPD